MRLNFSESSKSFHTHDLDKFPVMTYVVGKEVVACRLKYGKILNAFAEVFVPGLVPGKTDI